MLAVIDNKKRKETHMLIYPSLMGADQLHLAKIITTLEPYCAGFHLDTMDGHLVPNITGGPDWTNTISAFTEKPVWVHLMVTNPTHWIPHLQLPPISMIDFQYEAPVDHASILNMIHNKGHLAGVSVAPETSLDKIIPVLSHCDYISIMSVTPGFSGQKFIPNTIDKIKTLIQYKETHKLSFFIACDGGITESILPILHMHGITHVAIASALFKTNNSTAFLQKHNH
jgi:ribulose-phosphate 3-epimerase